MPIWLILLASLLTLIGIAGCILPGLPGPPFNYAALLLLHFNGYPFSDSSLIIFGVLTIVVLILDYTIPVFSARIFGATKTGIRGSIVGMVVGMFFTPVGMIGGLLLGAIIGDLMEGRSLSQATLSGAGTLLGALAGILIKTIVAVVISFPVWYVIVSELF